MPSTVTLYVALKIKVWPSSGPSLTIKSKHKFVQEADAPARSDFPHSLIMGVGSCEGSGLPVLGAFVNLKTILLFSPLFNINESFVFKNLKVQMQLSSNFVFQPTAYVYYGL